jgi:hypothetical protein
MADVCADEPLVTPAPEPPENKAKTSAESPKTASIKKRTKLFLDHLSERCNVAEALAVSGLASSSLYHKRRSCAKFRAAWDAALEQGYSRLEADLLDRALNGENQQVLNRKGDIVTLKKISNALGLALLKQHGVRVAAIRALHGTNHDEHAMEAKIAIIRKLEQLARHKAKQQEAQQAGTNGSG